MSDTHDQTASASYKKKKWEILFDYLDVNRDGILDWDEFMHFPQKLINSGKQEPGERLKSLYTECWARFCEAINLPRDNKSFTKEQWIAGFQVVHKTPWFAETFIPTISRIYFDSLDNNEDGTISLQEWRVYNNNRGLTDESVIRSTFNRLDTDGDGRITREEMCQAIFLFTFGDDPSEDFSFLYAIY